MELFSIIFGLAAALLAPAAGLIASFIKRHLERSAPDRVVIEFKGDDDRDVRVTVRSDMKPSEISEKILAAKQSASGPRAAAH